jgi:SAM-dependent methyltransferase
MDRLIKRFDAVADNDLMLCEARGIAYQKYMNQGRVEYDAEYFKKVEAYDGSPIARAVNAGRCELLLRHLAAGASVLDWGAGSGAFIRDAAAAGFAVKGYDVNPQALHRLTTGGLVAKDPYEFDAVTLWDTIEHMEQAESVLRAVRKGAHLFVSVPVFEDLRRIRESKHYRPGEHLYYWTPGGFVQWMGCTASGCSRRATMRSPPAGRASAHSRLNETCPTITTTSPRTRRCTRRGTTATRPPTNTCPSWRRS